MNYFIASSFHFASNLTTQNEILKNHMKKILHYFKTCCNKGLSYIKKVKKINLMEFEISGVQKTHSIF